MESIVKTLLEQGSMVALMSAMLWILIKKLLNVQDDRIKALEASSIECQKDRKELHDEISEMKDQHIQSLKNLLNRD